MARKAKSSKKGTNDNLLRASKQKTKKIERIGLHREDGKAFKQVSERSERAYFEDLSDEVREKGL